MRNVSLGDDNIFRARSYMLQSTVEYCDFNYYELRLPLKLANQNQTERLFEGKGEILRNGGDHQGWKDDILRYRERTCD